MSEDNRRSAVKSYRDLEVWQVAVKLSVAVYRITSSFPREERYGLTSQMRRAAVSVAANMAEGYGRESTASFVQFLRISQGSLKELETHIVIAREIGMLEVPAGEQLDAYCASISRMLQALVRSLERNSA